MREGHGSVRGEAKAMTRESTSGDPKASPPPGGRGRVLFIVGWGVLALLGVGWALASAVFARSEGLPPVPGRWPTVLMSLVGAGFFGAGAVEAWRSAAARPGHRGRRVFPAGVEACVSAYLLVEAALAAFWG
jgi:hypothetical protein